MVLYKDNDEDLTFSQDKKVIIPRNEIYRYGFLKELIDNGSINNGSIDGTFFNKGVDVLFEKMTSSDIAYLSLSPDDAEKVDNYLDYRPFINDHSKELIEYYEIYNREKTYSNLNGFEYLIEFNFMKNKKSKHGDAIFFIDLIGKLKRILGEYKNNVVIAGGYITHLISTFKYKQQDKSRQSNYDDIDLFIYGVDEITARKILKIIAETEFKFLGENEQNIIFSGNAIKFQPEYSKMNNLQVILRIYSSPSEIIHGFDVDCCCALATLDGDIYVTERGHFALKNKLNIINFERMSPSYEYRIMKYFDRGFLFEMPGFWYFINNFCFDFSKPSFEGSDILYFSLLRTYITGERLNKDLEKKSDYHLDEEFKYMKYPEFLNICDNIQFNKTNPNEQATGTFHKKVYEDIKIWFNRMQLRCEIYIPSNLSTNLFKIDKHTFLQIPNNCKIYASDLFCPRRTKVKELIYPDFLNRFLLKCEGIVISGMKALGTLTNEHYSSPVDIYFLNDKKDDFLDSLSFRVDSIIRKFFFFSIKNWIPTSNISNNIPMLNKSFENYSIKINAFVCGKEVPFMEIDNLEIKGDDFVTVEFIATYDQKYRISSLRIYLKNFNTYENIIEEQKFDFTKLILIPSKNHPDGEFIVSDTAIFHIKNKMHTSNFHPLLQIDVNNKTNPIFPKIYGEKIWDNILMFFKYGFRFKIDRKMYISNILLNLYCDYSFMKKENFIYIPKTTRFKEHISSIFNEYNFKILNESNGAFEVVEKYIDYYHIEKIYRVENPLMGIIKSEKYFWRHSRSDDEEDESVISSESEDEDGSVISSESEDSSYHSDVDENNILSSDIILHIYSESDDSTSDDSAET